MECGLMWLGLGALIGAAAAQKKGFGMAAGIIGGALLGILSPLLFFVSGVAGNDLKRKCPHCAEWVQAKAQVCKHCGRDIGPPAAPAPPSRAAMPGYGSPRPKQRP